MKITTIALLVVLGLCAGAWKSASKPNEAIAVPAGYTLVKSFSAMVHHRRKNTFNFWSNKPFVYKYYLTGRGERSQDRPVSRAFINVSANDRSKKLQVYIYQKPGNTDTVHVSDIHGKKY